MDVTPVTSWCQKEQWDTDGVSKVVLVRVGLTTPPKSQSINYFVNQLTDRSIDLSMNRSNI